MTESDEKTVENKEPSALAQLGALPKLPRIFSPFGFGSDIGLGFSHNLALDIAREVLNDLPKQGLEELYREIMAILLQWKYEHGRLHPPRATTTFLGSLLGGVPEPEPEKELSETDRLAQIKSLDPWQCHAMATTPIALFNQLYYESYKPLKDYLDGNNWQKYHYIQAILILLSNSPESDSQTSDCIYEGMKLALWQLQHKKGLVKILMPDAMAMWKARQKSKLVREDKKQKKNAEIDAKVSAAHKNFCKEGKAPSAIQRHIQRETQLNQTEVSRSMARLGLSTRKKKELQK